MEISRLENVMNYYYLVVNQVDCLVITDIVLVIMNIKKNEFSKLYTIILFLTLLSGISQYMFLGVLADNQVDVSHWKRHMQILFGIYLILLIILFSKYLKKQVFQNEKE